MSQFIAHVAARVATAADFVARTTAPVDAHGASPSAYTSFSSSRSLFTDEGPAGAGIYRLPPLLKEKAEDVEAFVNNGPAFRLKDLVSVRLFLVLYLLFSLRHPSFSSFPLIFFGVNPRLSGRV